MYGTHTVARWAYYGDIPARDGNLYLGRLPDGRWWTSYTNDRVEWPTRTSRQHGPNANGCWPSIRIAGQCRRLSIRPNLDQAYLSRGIGRAPCGDDRDDQARREHPATYRYHWRID
jgi:hypothetical protein